tara:strand:- start:647 stop:808 length:162 start_codon:yes stop_codon:yes gene_type:complete
MTTGNVVKNINIKNADPETHRKLKLLAFWIEKPIAVALDEAVTLALKTRKIQF